MSKINISKYHPIADIKDHLIFSNNGNVVACYRVELPEIYSLSEKDFEDMHSNWFQAMKSLPVGTVVHKQDICMSSKKLDFPIRSNLQNILGFTPHMISSSFLHGFLF